jgi:Xaa-Pro aminopeptidase
VRGGDVLYNPVVHAYGIVTHALAFFYVDKQKTSVEVQQYLLENGIEIREYDSILEDVKALAEQPISFKKAVKNTSNNKIAAEGIEEKEAVQTNGHQSSAEVASAEPLDAVDSLEDYVANHRGEESDEQATEGNREAIIWVDPGSCSYMVYSHIPADQVLLQQSPLALAKALKHPLELEGMRKAHIRDGAAVVSYLAWLDAQMQDLYGAAGYFSEVKGGSLKRKRSEEDKLTEVTVSDKLAEFRSKQEVSAVFFSVQHACS